MKVVFDASDVELRQERTGMFFAYSCFGNMNLLWERVFCEFEDVMRRELLYEECPISATKGTS
jgi:hypothetical protein